MGLIKVLSADLVNRIAAGECVERPASVVKELIENALDAGASRIDVLVHEGGRSLIQVADDACGMSPDDLRLSVQPHATSKIDADEDLFSIHTLGFRGEALASIGSVSRLKVTSRRRDSDVAHSIQVAAGEVTGPTPCVGPPGTTVEVRDLFYCVPARRKFLRTNQTEIGHITEQFTRLALAQPGIAFSLTHQKRTVHRLPPVDSRHARIANFFSPELAEVLLPIRREGNGVRVEGFVAPPAQCRKSGKWEYIFVNGRHVRDRFVSHAIREAYRSLIQPNEHPVAFVFITIDPSQVDVNVHPTKVEVRWRDSNYIHGQVLAALRERFLSENLDRSLRRPPEDDEYRERVRAAMVDFFTTARPSHGGEGTKVKGSRDQGIEGPRQTAATQNVAAGWHGQAQREHVLADDAQDARAPGPGTPPIDPNPQSPPHSEPGTQSSAGWHDQAQRGHVPVRPAIQLHNAYLVAETDDGLMIIDQHALHERILYEELRARITQRPLEAQRLLLPEVIRVPAERIEALETHADALARLGVELTASGPQSVTLHAFPSLLLERVDVCRFVRDLLDLLSERGARPDADTLLHEILDLMACKAAVKAGDALTPDEVKALLARRELADRSSNCPHGRPTTLRLTLRDLERQFKRR